MNSTTSSALVPFDFEGSQLRVFADEHGDPWFVATDLCSVLGIGNPRQATTRLDGVTPIRWTGIRASRW